MGVAFPEEVEQMALHKLGYELGVIEVPPANEKWSGHATAQTVAAIVMALATVFAVIKQTNSRIAWTLVGVIVLTLALMYGNRMLAFLRVRQAQAARNKAAQALRAGLLRFAKRFFQFTNSGDPSSLRNIVFNACGNKCGEVCAGLSSRLHAGVVSILPSALRKTTA